jgi:hypothetical protein
MLDESAFVDEISDDPDYSALESSYREQTMLTQSCLS